MSLDGGRDEGAVSWIDAAVAFQRTLRLCEAFLRPILTRYGHPELGAANALTLLAVGHSVTRIADLVRDGRYPSSNANYSLAALERAGLVVREHAPGSRKVKVVYPTSEGLLLVRAIRTASEGSGVPVDDAMEAVATFESRLATALRSDPPVSAGTVRRSRARAGASRPPADHR